MGLITLRRSYLDPVWNHYSHSPARIWSQDGPGDLLDAKNSPLGSKELPADGP